MKEKVYYTNNSLETGGITCRVTQKSANGRWADRQKKKEIVSKSFYCGFCGR